MALLASITLVTDPEATFGYVWTALIGGLIMTAIALTRGAGRPAFVASWGFLAVDGVVALGVAILPWLAGAKSIFFGGYPVSWLIFLVFALRLRFAMVGVGLLISSQVLGANLSSQPFDAMGLVRSILANVVVVSTMGLGVRWLRAMDGRREAAETALTEERERRIRSEERADLAGKLHDSAIQTLVVLQGNADEPEQVRRLARRQERELRDLLVGMRDGEEVRLSDALRVVANDVEQLHDVRIERVIIGDLDDGQLTTALSTAAREALINAAKHSGENKAHLFAEVSKNQVTLLVRDRGVGFNPSDIGTGFGLRSSIIERIESIGGTVDVRSSGGRGTAIEMTVPRVSSE
jgi:signal transduction histidine kinase